MIINLVADRFRNLQPLDWWPTSRSNLLLGENGAGKTSLLEAVYVVATTRSFRTNYISDYIKYNNIGFRILAEIDGGARVRLEVACEHGLRTRRVNGHSTVLSDHLAVLPVVAWSSRDSDLLTGQPGVRRRFLDRGIVSTFPNGLEVLSRYRQILGHKRRLLVNGGRDVEPWNDLFSQVSYTILKYRTIYIEKICREIEEMRLDRCLALPQIRVSYQPSFAAEDQGLIRQQLDSLAARESESRRPLVGPHLDDLAVDWIDRPIKGVASAGERKVVGLMLLAAHGRILEQEKRRPVYLLDDVDSELSSSTLQRIWSLFSSAEQLLATSNRPEVWKGLAVEQTWKVETGKVSRL